MDLSKSRSAIEEGDQFSVNKGVGFDAAFYNRVVPRAPNFAVPPSETWTPRLSGNTYRVVISDKLSRVIFRISLTLNPESTEVFSPCNHNSMTSFLLRWSCLTACDTSVVMRYAMHNQNLKEQLTRLFDRMSEEAIALLLTQLKPESVAPEPSPEWMTASQLARYWQIVNSNGETTTAGILKWARRSENEHPLPHAYLGDLLRFHRAEVDVWAKEEAARRRTQNENRRLRIA